LLLLNKIYYYLILLVGFGFYESKSQNLIVNGSFENYNTPINWNNWGGGFFDVSVFPTQRILLDWDQFQSPDYFISACTHTYSGVPINLFGYNLPEEGNNYAGIGFYIKGTDTKEYIYQQLLSPLVSGMIYCLNFYVSKSERSTYSIKNIGAYFSSSIPNLISSSYINEIPQVLNQNGFITDTANWIPIQGCFTAVGGEQYITIGNFNLNTTTDTLNLGTNNPIGGWPKTAYYYIDDINLIDQTTVGINELNNVNGISVYPNPTKDILNINVGTLKENTEVKIYNSLGELVLTESLTTQNSSLKTHNLLGGIYFYHILVGKKSIKTDKIVIIK
jgi:hypothetical protein